MDLNQLEAVLRRAEDERREADVVAVPGAHSIIDTINPLTNRTSINQQTVDEVAARCPGAVRMTWADWRADQIARQNTPIIWLASTREQYRDMLEVLPPAAYLSDCEGGEGFLVGEPWDHSYETGAPRFAAFWFRCGQYLTADRPLTRAEFRAQLAALPGRRF